MDAIGNVGGGAVDEADEYEITCWAARWAEREHPMCGKYRTQADDWYPLVSGMLDDRARPGADHHDDYFVVMAIPDDGAVWVGRWEVRFVQVMGLAGHGFVVEFGTRDPDGAQGPSYALFRRDVTPPLAAAHCGDGHRDDGMCAVEAHSLQVVRCAFRCLAERRDLTHHFDLKVVWPYGIAEYQYQWPDPRAGETGESEESEQ